MSLNYSTFKPIVDTDKYSVGDEVMVKLYAEWRYGIIQSFNEDNTVNVVLVRKIIVNNQTREAHSGAAGVERENIRKVFKNTNHKQTVSDANSE